MNDIISFGYYNDNFPAWTPFAQKVGNSMQLYCTNFAREIMKLSMDATR